MTVALLTGYPPFGGALNNGNSAGQAREDDLARLDEEMVWNNTGQRARDFINRLLVLDESKRMDVKQALEHDWFTNSAHRQEFEALYKRSIRDWKPHVHEGAVIEDFCSFTGSSEAMGESQGSEHVSSVELSGEMYLEGPLDRHSGLSNMSHASMVSGGWVSHTREGSLTLSDPALPPHRVKTRQESMTGGCSVLPQAKDTMDCDVDTTGLLSRTQFWSPGEESEQVNQNEDLAQRYPDTVQHGSQSTKALPDLKVQSRAKTRKSIWDDFGEVYEEVDNSITGRSERFPYGSGH